MLKCATCRGVIRHALIKGDGHEPPPRRIDVSEDLDAALSRVDRLGVIVTYAPRLSTSAVWVPEYDLMVLNDQRSDDHLARAIARLITLIDAGPDDD